MHPTLNEVLDLEEGLLNYTYVHVYPLSKLVSVSISGPELSKGQVMDIVGLIRRHKKRLLLRVNNGEEAEVQVFDHVFAGLYDASV